MANETNTLKALTKAILEKNCIAINCEGHSRLITIDPHAIYSDGNSKLMLDFYQHPISETEEGTWNTIAWREIHAVFLLNTTFLPRLEQEFALSMGKYQAGLLAMVGSNYSPKEKRLLWSRIESSINRMKMNYPITEARNYHQINN